MAEKRRLTQAQVIARIPAARQREQDARSSGLRAACAFYDAPRQLVIMETTAGFLWGVPRSRIPALNGATDAQLAEVSVSPSGGGLHWDALDVQLSVPGLLIESLGSSTLAKALAQRGGQATTTAKVEASRRNGALGGRPRKSSGAAGVTVVGGTASGKRRKDLHVVPAKGKFVVKEEGNPKPLTRPATQAESIARAKPIARRNQVEVVIHRRDGTIRDSDNYGPGAKVPRSRKE